MRSQNQENLVGRPSASSVFCKEIEKLEGNCGMSGVVSRREQGEMGDEHFKRKSLELPIVVDFSFVLGVH